MATKGKILLVDDEPDILEFLGYNLISEGYEVEKACDGIEALEKVKEFKPDLVLLDVMMPRMDGIEACETIRKIEGSKKVVIAFLSARGEDFSQIAAFDAGGDDYIVKPIRPKLLVSKIKSLLKRNETELESQPQENFIIDKERYCVTIKGKDVALPRKEFELLSLLASRPDRVFSRDEIFAAVWGSDVIVGDRTIDVHIRKMRERIGDDHIVTIKGVGYKFIHANK